MAWRKYIEGIRENFSTDDYIGKKKVKGEEEEDVGLHLSRSAGDCGCESRRQFMYGGGNSQMKCYPDEGFFVHGADLQIFFFSVFFFLFATSSNLAVWTYDLNSVE